ncbi:unnamed protein product [Cuscuta campestris]|uniref:Uncharacterized protein n=1 Tax=Cuscuta campestris TaxID=132261 RepID=A0A484LFZ7_9ASTE|nr:unnamed protein product [Cuscuta campestris]
MTKNSVHTGWITITRKLKGSSGVMLVQYALILSLTKRFWNLTCRRGTTWSLLNSACFSNAFPAVAILETKNNYGLTCFLYILPTSGSQTLILILIKLLNHLGVKIFRWMLLRRRVESQ